MNQLVAAPARVGLLSLVVATLGCGGGGADPAVDAAPTVDAACAGTPVRDLAYQAVPGVAPALQALDVYPVCAGAPAPVVIWVHGGAWAIGDKANSMADKVALWNRAGYLVVSVNYRLSPNTPDLDPGRLRHPLHAQDVATAIDWVSDHVAAYGGDPARIALVGHSAGAHLVALVGTDPSFLAAHQRPLTSLRCVGSLDTEAYDVPRALRTATAMQALILRNAFGDDPAVQAAASPITHVVAGAGIPPFLVVRRGAADRQATEQAFHDRLRAVGVPSTLIDASSLTHEEVNDHIGAAGDQVMTAPLVSFLAACLR